MKDCQLILEAILLIFERTKRGQDDLKIIDYNYRNNTILDIHSMQNLNIKILCTTI